MDRGKRQTGVRKEKKPKLNNNFLNICKNKE